MPTTSVLRLISPLTRSSRLVELSHHAFHNAITHFGAHDVTDLAGLYFEPGATATYQNATHHLTVHSGPVTDAFTLISPHGTHFQAASDHHGGTDVFLVFA
jgi:hypothetical protein